MHLLWNYALARASADGDLEGICRAVHAGADIETRVPPDMHSRRARAGDTTWEEPTVLDGLSLQAEEVLELGEHGAMTGQGDVVSLGPADEEGRLTPLMRAARRAHREAVGMLLQLGADVAARDDAGMTPLHHAAVAGCLQCCEALARAGASSDAWDSQARDPLACVPARLAPTAAERGAWQRALRQPREAEKPPPRAPIALPAGLKPLASAAAAHDRHRRGGGPALAPL